MTDIFKNHNKITRIREKEPKIIKKSTFFNFHRSLDNHLEIMYPENYNNYKNSEQIFDNDEYKNRIAIFKDVVVSNRGRIITSDKSYTNGGCLCLEESKLIHPSKSDEKFKQYPIVISIAAGWGNGIFHFPVEALTALKCFPNGLKCISPHVYLHVYEKTPYIEKWLELANINIKWERVIDGSLYVKKLFIPEMGKCGNPYLSQISWLKNRVQRNITYTSNTKKQMLLMKRNKTRKILNHNQLQIQLKHIEPGNYNFVLFDDNNLPESLIEQQTKFANSDIIIGPHGGGCVNIFACKEGSLFIEFVYPKNINLCYARIAYFLNIHYYAVPINKGKVDINHVKSIIKDYLISSKSFNENKLLY